MTLKEVSFEYTMKHILTLPSYAKYSLFLVGIYVLVSMLFIAQDILLPLIYATLIAILLSPVVDFLTRKKINRALAIALTLSLVLIILAVCVILISSQASLLSEAWPSLIFKLKELLHQSTTWISVNFHIDSQQIDTEISKAKMEMNTNSNKVIGFTVSTVGSILSSVFLFPVYIFMILYYHNHLLEFIHQLFGAQNGNQVSAVLSETKKIIQSYLIGLVAELAIVSILNSIGLLLLGIDYAILLGILGAFLNVIPYLGGIIAMAIFMTIALLTKSPVYVLYVAALYSVIQLIDNNYIVPKIVGSKVKLNALVSLLVVIAGAGLWGIPGMFLSIPITAIIKVICDHVVQLKPLGFVLGNTVNNNSTTKNINLSKQSN